MDEFIRKSGLLLIKYCLRLIKQMYVGNFYCSHLIFFKKDLKKEIFYYFYYGLAQIQNF